MVITKYGTVVVEGPKFRPSALLGMSAWAFFVCLFRWVTSKSTIFQLCWEDFLSSWVKPVLSSDKVSCPRHNTVTPASSESWTSNPSIPGLKLYQLSHWAPLSMGIQRRRLRICDTSTGFPQKFKNTTPWFFHDFFHDQQYNFHDYLMHGLQPPLLVPSSPHWA